MKKRFLTSTSSRHLIIDDRYLDYRRERGSTRSLIGEHTPSAPDVKEKGQSQRGVQHLLGADRHPEELEG
jgi:hypothetical protein